ncbi:hypothetical protein ELH43_08670 [Rhizobium ruizarguesonis]|jgi:hypothetical protein|uniref:Uncharacterized protein n=1 Tax=Rhizobium phage vB_RleA_TRX32-1 TaxID=2777321 RepID=A0A7T7GRU3_9CAUD|nr:MULTISPECIES: hypothetical protein [Rhizobium]QQM14038.1 hypothetical protein [Rhizobium phage vB_RleA_TRX32-1]MBY3320700.1 hypothetical protein [Rhizobium laguerreae]MBY3335508.1 hypothetical protein [Rhizobium laguerreae]TAY37188.1 hypothetical protein ELH89_08715 [Rhizobium leguminosarum]TBA26004.1 hypothetical protein ELH61_09455 [Rhizobium ruizarguesonis]
MEHMNTEALLLIGRVEGKVDTLISLSSAQSQRIDQLEGRMSAGEVDIASLKAKSTTNQSFVTNITAILALIVAAISAYLSYK